MAADIEREQADKRVRDAQAALLAAMKDVADIVILHDNLQDGGKLIIRQGKLREAMTNFEAAINARAALRR